MKKSQSMLRELLDPLDVMWRAARVRHLSRWGRECRAKLTRWSGTQQARAVRAMVAEASQSPFGLSEKYNTRKEGK